MRFLLTALAFLFSSVVVSAAGILEICESNVPLYKANEELNDFLSQQSLKFSLIQTQLQNEKAVNCSPENKKISLNLVHQFMSAHQSGLDNFIFSYASFWSNNCKQDDTQKVLSHLEKNHAVMLNFAAQCQSTSALQEVYSETNDVFHFLRDTSSQEEADENQLLNKYWKEDLYKDGSLICPSDSWKEVKEEFCALQENIESLNANQKSLSDKVFTADKAEEDRRKKVAEATAQAYLKENINFPFFSLEFNSETNNKIWTAVKDFFGNSSGVSDKVTEANKLSSETQSLSAITENKTKVMENAIIQTRVDTLLTDVRKNYYKTYEVQKTLEREIDLISESVKDMHDNSGDKDLTGLLKLIREVETQKGLKCSY